MTTTARLSTVREAWKAIQYMIGDNSFASFINKPLSQLEQYIEENLGIDSNNEIVTIDTETSLMDVRRIINRLNKELDSEQNDTDHQERESKTEAVPIPLANIIDLDEEAAPVVRIRFTPFSYALTRTEYALDLNNIVVARDPNQLITSKRLFQWSQWEIAMRRLRNADALWKKYMSLGQFAAHLEQDLQRYLPACRAGLLHHPLFRRVLPKVYILYDPEGVRYKWRPESIYISHHATNGLPAKWKSSELTWPAKRRTARVNKTAAQHVADDELDLDDVLDDCEHDMRPSDEEYHSSSSESNDETSAVIGSNQRSNKRFNHTRRSNRRKKTRSSSVSNRIRSTSQSTTTSTATASPFVRLTDQVYKALSTTVVKLLERLERSDELPIAQKSFFSVVRKVKPVIYEPMSELYTDFWHHLLYILRDTRFQVREYQQSSREPKPRYCICTIDYDLQPRYVPTVLAEEEDISSTMQVQQIPVVTNRSAIQTTTKDESDAEVLEEKSDDSDMGWNDVDCQDTDTIISYSSTSSEEMPNKTHPINIPVVRKNPQPVIASTISPQSVTFNYTYQNKNRTIGGGGVTESYQDLLKEFTALTKKMFTDNNIEYHSPPSFD